MSFDHGKLYDAPTEFFKIGGNCTMQLTPDAAVAACRQAEAHKLVVIRIEGGIHRNGIFEMRLDCIWDSPDDGSDHLFMGRNNLIAAEFVRQESNDHNAFVLTTTRQKN